MTDYADEVNEHLSMRRTTGTPPDSNEIEGIRVFDHTPQHHATRLYGVSLDYGWCTRVICSNCYLHDAQAITYALANCYPKAKIDILGAR